MAYRTVSTLDELIKKYKIDVSILREKDITIKEVLEELGTYAGLSWNTVKQIKNGVIQPSLISALRIADFFNTNVEDIWKLEYYEKTQEESEKIVSEKEGKEQKFCTHDDCFRPAIARGFCNKHYQKFRNKNKELFNQDKPTTCTVENCTNPHHAKGLCSYHYYQQYRERGNENE